MIGAIYAAWDRGTHVELDLDVEIDGTTERVRYNVIPGCGDRARVHVELERRLAAGEIVPTDPPLPDLADAQTRRIAEAWSICAGRIEAGEVEVETTAGTHTYSIDAYAQGNIKSVLLGVALGVTPDPRPWTPRGELTPISVTHADLTAIGAAMMGAVDAEVQAYLAHKSALLQMTEPGDVLAYDLTNGWPD
jgi:hypothetical protein